MDFKLGHPYAQTRKCRSLSTSSLVAHFPPVPTLPAIKDLESWLPSIGSDRSPMTAFFTVMEPPSSDKLDTSPPALPAHGFPYVKHSNGVTVILSGHKAGTSLPLYPSGSSICGSVVLSKFEGITSLDVKVSDPFIMAVFSWHSKFIFALVGRMHLCTRNPGRLQE
jgi:hypothetical protein